MVDIARSKLLGEHFYFLMSLLVVVPVAYGFSFTVDKNLIHPALPRPGLLYLHAAVFTGWLAFFVLQSGLVRMRNVAWHRRTGVFGIAFGTALPIVGVATALVMARFNTTVLKATDAEQFFIIPLWDMLCFATAFALAMRWRRRPEFHRRLVFIATCALTAAGFGRFPEWLVPAWAFYAGVDLLILLGAARDRVVAGRVHPVYRVALPILIVGQVAVTCVAFSAWPAWLRIAHALLS